MTKEEIFEAIQEWENNHGESFYDYFADDNIKTNSWAFWLLGMGRGIEDNDIFSHANNLVNVLSKKGGEEELEQEDKFCIYPESDEDTGEFNNDNVDRNQQILATFLSSSQYYTNLFLKWYKSNK